MFNDLFWFSMAVASIGSTALVVVGIAFPASPGAPRVDRTPGHRQARFGLRDLARPTLVDRRPRHHAQAA